MVVVLLAACCSFLLLRVLIPQLRCLLLDEPNSRSSHRQPTPRGGGISFVAVSSLSSFIALFSGDGFPTAVLPLLSFPLAFVGLVDDRHNLPSLWRYGVQLFTAALILGVSPLVKERVPALIAGNWLITLALIFLVIAITAVINFTNFMDGLDGLVGCCMLVSIAAVAFSLKAPWSIWALVGSLLGFLFWNWSPAKVFMGDVGSTFLGALFAGLVLQAPTWSDAFNYLLAATPLLGDAFFCVLRRLIARQRVFQAHRLHLFQRLHQAGWSHARVSLIYLASTVLLAVAMLAGGWLWLFILVFAELFLGIWLDQRVAVPFAMASKS